MITENSERSARSKWCFALMTLKNVVLGIDTLPGRVSVGITAVTIVSAISIVVSKTGVQFRVDDRLRYGYWHVFDDGDGVRLGHFDGVRGGNCNLDWNVDGNGYGAVYWDRNMLGDLDRVGFGHLDGVRAIDGYGVWHLEEKGSNTFDHRWSTRFRINLISVPTFVILRNK